MGGLCVIGQVLIAPDVLQPEKRVAVRQTATDELAILLLAAHTSGNLVPVDRKSSIGPHGIRRGIAGQRFQVSQGMPAHRSRDSIITCLPYAPPRVGIRLVRALIESVVRGDLLPPGEVGKEERVRFHQILQSILIIVMPACRVDMERHGYVVGLFKANRLEHVLASSHLIPRLPTV